MVLISVDLPQPLGPRIAICSPLAMRSEISCSTIFSPRATEACSSSTKLPRSAVITKSLKVTESAAVVILSARARADEDDPRGAADGLQFFAHGARSVRCGGRSKPGSSLCAEIEPVKIGAMRKGIAMVGHGSRSRFGEQRVPEAKASK